MEWWSRSLKGLALAGLLVGAWLAFPALRGLLWVHVRTALPESYVLPLPGLRVTHLEPTFGAPRLHGPHEGIDVPAPAGTPVLAVADGVVVDDRPTPIGGIVLWIQGSGRRLYYYAHMRDLAPGLRRGSAVRAGERIGSVGNTGNAVTTPPHLHFAIYHVTSDLLPLRYRAVDPYPPLLKAGRTMDAVAVERSAPPDEAPDLAPPFDPAGVDALTPNAIADAAEAAADRLASVLRGIDPFLGGDADGDVRRVPRVYELPERLRSRAATLRRRAASDHPPERFALGRRLHQQSQRLAGLLDWYERCAPRERSAFLSGLETLALDAARESAPASGPRVDYFFFEGRTPDLVPAAGGWLVLTGRDLWPSDAPVVELVGADAEPVARFEPHPLDGGNGVAVHVSPTDLAAQPGRCLSLRWRAAEGTVERSLPLCVPASHRSGFRVAGYLAYRLPSATRTLETNEILFSNSSCDDRKEVSHTLEWPLDPEGRLIDTGQLELYANHEASIDCRIDGNRVICAGWLAPAACDGEGRVDTEWHHIFSPTEEYPDRELHRSAVISPFVPAGSVTRSCVEMRRNEQSEETTMWIDVFVQNHEQQERFFSSPHEVATGSLAADYEQGSYRIAAEYDPASEPGKASVCVAVRAPECATLGAP